MQPGSVVVDCSTSDPTSTMALAKKLEASGFFMADAPLGGTPVQAQSGELATMVGADAAVYERLKPVISAWAKTAVHIGPCGAGHKMKLLNNFLSLGYPRQHELAVALREIGRIERTLFIIEWLLDTDMQRRAQIGLNKGEAHHALKNALRIGRQGEIRDRTAEGQHYRMAGLNLLAAIIIYWNTDHLGRAVTARMDEGRDCPPELLSHISPLGWAHILLTGEYRWPKR